MMIKNKSRFIFVLAVAVFTLGGMLLSPVLSAKADSNTLGPYTEINLPLDDLPALNEGLVYHPLLDMSSFSQVIDESYITDQSGARLQVLYVLKDPRDVPLARYAINIGNDVVVPDNDLIDQDLITINVYVRVEMPLNKAVTDPVLYSEHAGQRWPALYVVPTSFELEGVSTYPCAPVEYADGTDPYQLPAGIDGGEAEGEDGLYDPAAYAPPKPWYYSEDPQLETGEVREGWVNCLAPDLPLEQLQVYYRDIFIPGPEIVYADEDRLQGEPFPEISELELIGLTNNDIPQTLGECDEVDYCFYVGFEGDFFTGTCEYQAQEAGLEQGLCVRGMVKTTDAEGNLLMQSVDVINPEAEVFQARVFFTREYEDPIQQSYLLWNYTVNRSYPVSLIRLDDILLTFIDENDNIIKDKGSVVFYDPVIDYSATGAYVSEHDSQVDREYENEILDGDDYALLSRVVVEPDNLSREDVKGYQLSVIGVQIDTLVEHEGVVLSAENRELFINDQLLQPSDPFEGIIYSGIGGKSVDEELEEEFSHLRHRAYGYMHPGTALIGIFPVYDELSSGGPSSSFHPVNVISIFEPNLIAETNMCDVVDCLQVSDPRDEKTPPRTVPVMCVGEWANNFIIDGADLVPVMYHIGEAWGLGRDPGYLHTGIDADWFENSKVLLYGGRVMGGAAPWWLYGTNQEGQFGSIIGHIVDLETGITLDNRAYVTHYYGRVDKNDLSQGYFAPADWTPLSNKGWIVDIADEKVLVFGEINPYDDIKFEVLNDSNTGFLFYEEGPIWVTECQHKLISNLTDVELYTQTNTAVASTTEGDEHRIKELLPGMDYPPSLPVIREEALLLGEYTDPVSRDGNYRVAVKQINIVPGKPDIPIVYVESEDKYYPAEINPNFNNEVFFQRSGAVVIPPDTSYVRVKVSVDFIDNGDRFATSCSLAAKSFQLVYPGYLPITGIGDRRRDAMWPCDNKDYSTWITYLFPSLDIDLDKLLFSVRTSDGEDPWFFLSLTEN